MYYESFFISTLFIFFLFSRSTFSCSQRKRNKDRETMNKDEYNCELSLFDSDIPPLLIFHRRKWRRMVGKKKKKEPKKKWINYELRIFLYLLYLLSFSSSNSTHVLFEVFLAKDEKCKGGTRRRGRKNEQRRMQQLWISRYGIVYNRSAQEKFLFFFFFYARLTRRLLL